MQKKRKTSSTKKKTSAIIDTIKLLGSLNDTYDF